MAGITLDQTATRVQKAGTAGLTLDISFGTAPAVGSTVIVPIAHGNFGDNFAPNNYVSVVDNQGNGTYSVVSIGQATGLQAQAHVAYKKITTSSGTFTLTYTFNLGGAPNSSTTFIQMGAISFTGLTGVLDRSATDHALVTNTTSLVLATDATVAANELVVALFVGDANDPTLNIVQNTAGYTNPTNGGIPYLDNDGTSVMGWRFDYQIVSAVGVQNSNWSFDAMSSGTAGVLATFVGPSASPMFRGH